MHQFESSSSSTVVVVHQLYSITAWSRIQPSYQTRKMLEQIIHEPILKSRRRRKQIAAWNIFKAWIVCKHCIFILEDNPELWINLKARANRTCINNNNSLPSTIDVIVAFQKKHHTNAAEFIFFEYFKRYSPQNSVLPFCLDMQH